MHSHISTHIHICTHTHALTHIYSNTLIHTKHMHSHTHTLTNTCIHTHAHTHVCPHTHTCALTHTYPHRVEEFLSELISRTWPGSWPWHSTKVRSCHHLWHTRGGGGGKERQRGWIVHREGARGRIPHTRSAAEMRIWEGEREWQESMEISNTGHWARFCWQSPNTRTDDVGGGAKELHGWGQK